MHWDQSHTFTSPKLLLAGKQGKERGGEEGGKKRKKEKKTYAPE